MARITILFGAALVLQTVVTFLISGESKLSTALIPAVIGVLLAICGFIALKDGLRKHAMHAAAMIGLLGGLAGLGRGVSQLPKLFSGAEINYLAFFNVWILALICFAFVALCVRSFIQARRQRLEKSE